MDRGAWQATEPGRLQSLAVTKSYMIEQLTYTSNTYIARDEIYLYSTFRRQSYKTFIDLLNVYLASIKLTKKQNQKKKNTFSACLGIYFFHTVKS